MFALRLDERVAEALGPVRGLRVLDAGGGDGDLAARLRLRGARAVSLDLRGGDVRGDVRRLPFAAGAFDRVACVLVLHYLPSPVPALQEFARVLRPGGRLVVCDRVGSPDPVLRESQEAVERLRNSALRRLWTSELIDGALRAAGFRVELREAWEEAVELDAWTASRAARERLRELRGRDLGGLCVSERHVSLRLRLFGAALTGR